MFILYIYIIHFCLFFHVHVLTDLSNTDHFSLPQFAFYINKLLSIKYFLKCHVERVLPMSSKFLHELMTAQLSPHKTLESPSFGDVSH